MFTDRVAQSKLCKDVAAASRSYHLWETRSSATLFLHALEDGDGDTRLCIGSKKLQGTCILCWGSRATVRVVIAIFLRTVVRYRAAARLSTCVKLERRHLGAEWFR